MNTSKTTHRNPITRRRWGQWALAAAAGVGLAACGGGGGGSDDSSTLREAFDRLQSGMTKKQVYELVGKVPSAIANEHYVYNEGSERLFISFFTDSSKTSEQYPLLDATWSIIGGQSITRSYA